MKRIIIFNLLIIISFTVHSQCPNLNFSMGDFTNWQCYSGSINGTGVGGKTPPIDGRHTIMDAVQLIQTGQLYDELCPKIKKVPDGFAYSAKIGNDATGAEIDAIEYTLITFRGCHAIAEQVDVIVEAGYRSEAAFGHSQNLSHGNLRRSLRQHISALLAAVGLEDI